MRRPYADALAAAVLRADELTTENAACARISEPERAHRRFRPLDSVAPVVAVAIIATCMALLVWVFLAENRRATVRRGAVARPV